MDRSSLPATVQELAGDADARGWTVTLEPEAVVLDCGCGGEHMYELSPVTGGDYRARNAREYLRRYTCWDEEARQ